MDHFMLRHHDEDHEEEDVESVSCPMIMTLHAGSCEAILFKSIKVTTPAQLVGAVIIIFLIAIAYEALRFWREKLYSDYQALQQITCANPKGLAPPRKTLGQLLTERAHLIQTILHMIQVTVSYALMLIVMTYNVWLVLAVILGAMVGYFAFGWIRQRTIHVAESCCH